MLDRSRLSENKRALLEKYLRGDLPKVAMAEAIGTKHTTAKKSNARERVVEIQVGGSKRPFFFLHGDYRGNAFYCFPLARELGEDQPFYALEPYSFDGLTVPPTFKAMAAFYIKLLRSVQPEGPYLLGGFCNGGLMAYEMARQLHSQGQRVDLLVSIDPPSAISFRVMHHVIAYLGSLLQSSEDKRLYWFLWLRHIYRHLKHIYRCLRFPYYRKLNALMNAEQTPSARGTLLELEARYELWLDSGRERLSTDGQNKFGCRSDTGSFILPNLKLNALFPDPIFPPADVLRHDWPGMYCWSYSAYVPDFYPGRSTFFFLSGCEDHHCSSRRLKVVGKKDKEIETHVIAGTQTTMKTEHLHDVAECLRICLNKAHELG